MKAGPVPPDTPAQALGGSEDLVAGSGCRAVLPPSASVPADRDDGGAPSIEERGVTASGVEGAIAGYGPDLFIRWDLVEQVGQNGAVTLVARGE